MGCRRRSSPSGHGHGWFNPSTTGGRPFRACGVMGLELHASQQLTARSCRQLVGVECTVLATGQANQKDYYDQSFHYDLIFKSASSPQDGTKCCSQTLCRASPACKVTIFGWATSRTSHQAWVSERCWLQCSSRKRVLSMLQRSCGED